ncbi:Ig-like domain-containing protein [Sulfurimonas sp.]|uniref:Ig-like domain-containing protein n=1 Tax=Sulfurimonas sp. TaxID=2022749 RepID=UPI00286D8F2A|nr:tandem-95 repeat protein [Sulfurimonas sp.]
MATIKDYLDYAELAQASYVIGLQTGMFGVGYGTGENNVLAKKEFTPQEANTFANRYTVLAVSNTLSGFSATLFIENTTGKKIFAIRGTEPTDGSDYYADWELTLSKHPEQYASLVSFFEDLKSSGKISTADNLVVTGHSLGGALTQMITATYPSYVDEAYTFNAPGVKNLSIPPLITENGKYYIRYVADELGTEISAELYNAYLSFDANKNSVGSKVVNVEAKDGPSVITDLGTDIGNSVLNIFINADMAYDYNHSSKTMTQALSFYRTLMFIDPTLTTTGITQFLEEVDGRNIIVKDKLGLHQELLSRMADILGVPHADTVFDFGQKIVDTGAKYSFDFLTDKTPTQLQSKSIGNLYALLNLNPFAIKGNLPSYSTINPDDYSDMYMSDRADYLYYILDKNARYVGGTGKDSYKAWDTNRVALQGTSGDQVIFGTNNLNNSYQLNGGEGNDRIYGLGGDDTFAGGGGNDYLEGGKGFDTLQGGAGHDVLFGDNDSDVLYGGEGQDTLVGGDNDNASDALFGGSAEDVLLGGGGDDTLAGGDASNLYADKELDYLAGGVGHDIYYVSHQDIINDADSTGFIMFNDKSLSGTKTKVDENTYEDANFTYTLNGPNMIVVDKNLGEYITIENMNFNNASGMGMEFDDGSETDPNKKDIEIYVGDATVTEGGTLEFTIGIDNTLDEDLVVNVSTYFNGSANSSDLSGTTNGTITIKAGTTYGTFEIATLDDTIVEPTENFIFAVTGLAKPYGGDDMNSFLIKNAGEGNIVDNDVPEQVRVTVSDGSRIEINGEISFTISLIGSLNEGETLTVNLSTYDNSATAGIDYAGVSGSVTFNSTSTTQTFSVAIKDDNYKEENETFYLAPTSFSYNGVKKILLDTAGIGTIIDDDDNGDIAIEVSSVSAQEGDTAGQSAQVKVSLSSALLESIHISLSNGGYVEIPAGSTSADATITWNGDTIPEENETIPVEILGFSYGGAENLVFGHGGTAFINDDDQNGNGHPMDPAPLEPLRRDPLVLDMDKNGFISTTSLEDSTAYFDLTGDGIQEKVGWLMANDGLVVYDKNENGKIDGIDEVFGNQTTSGFDELRQTADSNYDGVIDRRDELYSRLKVWQDTNQDGTSQADELVSLKDAGVTSINLNAVTTNIELNGSLLTEASKYTDTQGNLELAADLELEFDSRITKIDTSTIENYTEYDESKTLPNLRGYGIVSDSYITYNIDENFRTLALEFGSDVTKVANEFESFMDGWSGYTKMQTDLQTKYNLNDTPKLSDLDRKVWTYEHFMGTGSFSAGIEQRLETTARAMQSGGSDTAPTGRYNDAVVNRVYDSFTDRNRAFFSLKAFYPDVLSDALYEYGIDEYVITDQEALSAKVSAYINNPNNTLEEKLYLVSQMNTLQGTFLDFNADSITSNIDDTLVKNFVTAIYNDTLNAEVYSDKYFHAGDLTDIDVSSTSGLSNENALILGTDADEVINAKATSATVLAGKGDDRIYGYTGNNTYIYRTGDGADTIVDGGGNDTLNFSDMSLENVIIKSDGKDLLIAVAEDGKTFEELINKVTISNWIDSANRIENITFTDGSSPNFIELIKTQFITEGNDNFDLTNGNDTVEMIGGNDTVNALGGDDTVDGGAGNDTLLGGSGNDTLIGGSGDDNLQGGTGNDTYMYSRGDGKDTITDSSGNDTLKFAEGISSTDLAVRVLENGDMQIAIKEDGVAYEELSDKITIKNYTNHTMNIILFDGTSVDIDSLQVATDDNDNMSFGDSGVVFDGLGGDDVVTSGSGADTIDGGAGNDTINSGAGNDILAGGAGDDALVGGMGNDIYIYNRGDGKDTITDSYTYGYNGSSSQNAGNDTIKLGVGITKDDLLVTIIGSDIVVALKEEGKALQELTDIITIKNGALPNNAIENILLSDGTKLLIVDMQEATEGNDSLVFGDNSVSVDAMGGNDTITSGKGNDTLYGRAGNDTLRSNDGADSLYGGDGDDTLDIGRGDDTLNGGKGNDTLMGGFGNDTYIYNRGDGKDTIIDSYSYGNAGNDTLKFGEGINAEDIIAKAVGNDMIIALKEEGKTFEQLSDKLILKDWLDVNKRIENFSLADGTVLTLTQMQQATDGDDYLTFGDEGVSVDALSGNDTVISGRGNDTLQGGEGDDTLVAGLGDDIIEGGLGNDILRGEDGNDILYGDAGSDLIQGGRGNDTLYVGSGADILEGGEGNDTYVFTRGDETNSIIDTAGNDTLRFAEGIAKEDILVKAVGKDIIIALAEDGKSFEELSDRVIMKNWLDAATRVENIMLADGTLLNLSELFSATEGDDYLVFGDEGANVLLLGGNDTLISGSGDDTIDGGAGNDIIKSGDGDNVINAGDGDDSVESGRGNDVISGGTGLDTLHGGYGNDIYMYNLNDGVDTIYDLEGADKLRFGDGITQDDIFAKRDGLSLVVAIKESGKTFEEYSDKIIITNWFKSQNNIEEFQFSDNTIWQKDEIAEMFVDSGLPGVLYSKLGAILSGGSGNDTYVYSKGDYAVSINDSHFIGDTELQAGNDTLEFSGGINRTDVIFGTHNNDLIIKIEGAHDTYDELKDYVVIKDWQHSLRGIETIIFSDGEVLKINKDEMFEPINFDDNWIQGNYVIDGDDGDILSGNSKDNVIEGNGGDDTIYGNAGNDTIKGGAGDDIIISDTEVNYQNPAYADIIEGGIGKDTLQGGAGDDTYVFNRGDGQDIIYDYDNYNSNNLDYYNAGNDILQFGAGINADDLVLISNGNDLIVGLREEGITSWTDLKDKITITNWYLTNSKIENFKFVDYPDASFNDVIFYGTEGNDIITGVSNDNVMSGEAGDDIITGSAGNDIIDGGSGNDTLYGNTGADTIKGGAGDDIIISDTEVNYQNPAYADIIEGGIGKDTLQGGAGDDTYVFNRGDGQDIIYDYDNYNSNNLDYYNAGNDILQFGAGINADDLVLISNGNDLIVGLREEGITSWTDLKDKITITNWYLTNSKIENFSFSDGSSMTATEVANAAVVDTSGEFTAPLVLDLNHNDITSNSLETSRTYFDYDGDGDREHTAWTESGDAILAMDVNNDGAITDGGELFGNFTKLADGTFASDGYAALAQYDSNSDNIIDKNDNVFSDLLLWKDSNQDGKSSQSELISIQLSSVTAIHLSRENGITFEEYVENGNIISNETIFDSLNSTGIVRDVWFKYDSSNTLSGNDDIYTFNLGDGKDIIDDNDFSGKGIDRLILGAGISKDQVLMKWDRGTDDLLIGIKNSAEDDTPLKSTDNQIRIKNWFNSTGLIETIELNDGTTINRDAVYEILLSARDNEELTLRVLDEGNELSGGNFNDVLYGATGDEALFGEAGDDYLKGLQGNDLLTAGEGDDVLNGGTGDDTLIGDSGDDFYLYEKGDGRDTIIDSAGIDSIMFGEGIYRKDVLFRVSGDDMILTFEYDSNLADEARDSILITNFSQNGFEIENLEFFNGDGFSIPELIEKNTNHAPTTLFAESSYTLTDISIQTGIVLARDIDSDILNYTVSTSPENGTLSINKYGIWTYTSNDKYKGFDSAVITVDDGNGLSTTKTLNFEVVITNVDPIVLEAQTDVILQDIREATGDVGATDEDGDVLTYSVTTAALHGTVNVDETGTWIYSVEGTYIGTDSAVITVDDGQGGSVTKTLNFDTKVSAPSIDTVAFNLLEDNISTNNLNVYNPVGGALTYEIIATSENGTFTLDENGEYSYNPSQNYNGLDAVIVKVTNEYGLSTTSTLTFDIEAVNDAPVTTETEAFILQDVREQAGEVEATDVDGDILTFSVTTAAQHGTLSIDETGAWTYSVDGYYMGEDSAVITVDDGNGGTATKTLTFDARVTTPSLADATANLLEDNPSNGIFNVTNPIGGVLTYEVLTSTANGDFSVDADGNWNYNPSQDYNGSDAVIVKVTNEYGLSTTSTLSFEIEAVNDAPIVALEGEAFTLINIRDIDGKIEANDVDGDTLTYTVDTQAANGVVTIDSEGNWHYKAEGSFNGENNATILIDDGNGATVRSTLNFTVDGYIYEGGDIVITDNGEDTLVMNEISQTSLSFAKDGNNMTISVKDQGLITLTDYFINVDSGVQTITTANGDINLGKDIIKNADESWWRGRMIADEDMKNLIIGNKHRDYLIGSNNSDILFSGDNNDMLQGLGGDDLLIAGKRNDRLYAGDGNDTVYGDSGNDKLYGEAGNDMLIGGDGNDTIFGGDGNDFLFGGLGSDKLEGARGDDTYFFEIGNQKSTIDDYEGQGKKSENAGYDTVKFGEGIYKEDISFIMKHGDLFFQYGDKDTIEIKNQDEISRQIEKFELADGSFLTNEDVDMVIQQLNAYSTDKKGMHTIDNETIRNNAEMMNIVVSAWQA